jgi:hypothetical protein
MRSPFFLRAIRILPSLSMTAAVTICIYSSHNGGLHQNGASLTVFAGIVKHFDGRGNAFVTTFFPAKEQAL